MSNQASGLRGVGSLRRLFRTLPPALTSEVGEAVQSGALMILREMFRRVPRDEGDLARELRVLMSRDKFSAKIGIIGARSRKRAYYAAWLNYGTTKNKAQPYIEISLQEKADVCIKILDAAVARMFDKLAAGSGAIE